MADTPEARRIFLRRVLVVEGTAIVGAILIWLLLSLHTFLLDFLISAILAIVLNPLVRLLGKLRIARSAELRVIAAMDARRSSRRIVADTVEAMQIDDDLVHVIAGPAAGEVFREIEFELTDARFAQLRSRLVESFIASGAKYSSAGSKLERALGLGH